MLNLQNPNLLNNSICIAQIASVFSKIIDIFCSLLSFEHENCATFIKMSLFICYSYFSNTSDSLLIPSGSILQFHLQTAVDPP